MKYSCGTFVEATCITKVAFCIKTLQHYYSLLREFVAEVLTEELEFQPKIVCNVENVLVRKFALNLLTVEGEKRPDMLRQRVCAGVKQACMFQRHVYPTKETSALVKSHTSSRRIEWSCVFDDVFRSTVLSSRKQREGLYRNLIAMFERVEPSENPPPSTKKKSRSRRSSILEESGVNADNALLSFAAQVLAYLPYTSSGDPLFIQHYITSIVALQGPQVLDKLAGFLRPYNLASQDVLDDNNAEEDAVRSFVRRFSAFAFLVVAISHSCPLFACLVAREGCQFGSSIGMRGSRDL